MKIEFLWDWKRLGLDERPRPIHLNHGAPNIDNRLNKTYIENILISTGEVLFQDEKLKIETTGLTKTEFIRTYRYSFSKRIKLKDTDGLSVLNLVEGNEFLIESDYNNYPPFSVHFGEAFIIPASCKGFTVKSADSMDVKLLHFFVK
ncbi:hypothetical protein ASN86_00588 [Streptococcus parauberis]|nr:hypothetical protein ASN86_00588 [Streptococcus parauberis]